MSAIAQQRKEHFTAEQFLAFLSTRPDEERWQLIDGMAVMMNPPTELREFGFRCAMRDLYRGTPLA
jgi:hypothetical protein